MIDADAPDLNFGVAPFPVPDDQADSYGKGYITGTIVGIASTSQKQNAAWGFVQFLTTDTKAVVDFANAIHNVPSTLAALASPDVSQDPAMQTFLDIASNPDSNTTPASPNGGAYQLTLQDVGYAYESGKQDDLQAGLAEAADADRHRHRPEQVTDVGARQTSHREHDHHALRRAVPSLARSRRGAGVAGRRCATSRSCRPGCSAPGCSSSTRCSRRVYFSFTHYNGFSPPTFDGLRELEVRLPATTRSSGRRCATRCGWSW